MGEGKDEGGCPHPTLSHLKAGEGEVKKGNNLCRSDSSGWDAWG